MNQNNSIGILGFLGLIFVTLKLCGVITWSWILVTMPFWIGVVIALLFCIIMWLCVLCLRLITPILLYRQKKFRQNICKRFPNAK